MLPETVSVLAELLVQVWLALRVTGAEMVTGAAPVAVLSPVLDVAGPMTIDDVLGFPGATLTEVTPAGVALNSSVLRLKKLSSVVLSAPVLALAALKITSVAAPGETPALVFPAESVVQFERPEFNVFHELLNWPRQYKVGTVTGVKLIEIGVSVGVKV